MEAIKLTVFGDFAFFKKPYINSMYLTYSNIHKTALLGMLGCIIDIPGLRQMKKGECIPEFYKVLEGLKVAIVPNCKGAFRKTIKTYVNSTGFAAANGGTPCTLIVKEQYLINPSWDIFISKGTVQDEIYEKLKLYLLNDYAERMPYLGKNSFMANFCEVDIVTVLKSEGRVFINSIFKTEDFITENDQASFYFEEETPVGYNKEMLGYYKLEKFSFTDAYVLPKNNVDIYCLDNKVLYFF